MVFIDVDKAYDMILKEVMQWSLKKKQISCKYIEIIKDMYNGPITNVRTMGREMHSRLQIGLHQASTLSPQLYVLVMDELTSHVQDEVPCYMPFADNIV